MPRPLYLKEKSDFLILGGEERTKMLYQYGNIPPKYVTVRHNDRMFYRDGWFVLVEETGNVSVMTREDARRIEKAYVMFCNNMSSVYDPVRSPISAGRNNRTSGTYHYEVDDLADPSEDEIIDASLKIPAKIGGFVINMICRDTFQNLDITSLELPDSVREIRSGAFDGCDHLINISMGPDTVVAEDAFMGVPSVAV